ncbi:MULTISPECIES: TetR/AcrR family transcriptional regulator [Sphingobium]|uniref:TetR/AcrR family transcriptional regulator n=2 Tax=Sphingobium TaxID=165695 RepID=A0A9X7YFL7_SPHYA|nr:TetR/AcrR family transcriptional regulator [Sphingobium yanoikuyae]QNG48777.1 TetR/AcrR family transcriptional regulator [Sphingobium yanoikuyae]
MTIPKSSSRKRPLPARDPRGGRPTQDVAARLSDHILEIALAQFIAQGPEKTSMDDIAAAANVSKRTLYARYGSKTGLLVAVMRHGIDDRLKPIAATMRTGCLRERLLRTAQKMLDLSLKPETIGFEKLAYWVRDQNVDDIDVQTLLGINPGSRLIQTLLEEAAGPERAASLDMRFLGMFIFDALVTSPRQRILVRKDLPNTAAAKTAYLEQATDFIFKAILTLSQQPECGP